MQSSKLIIDENLVQKVIEKKRFEISFLDYCFYMIALCLFAGSVGFFCDLVRISHKPDIAFLPLVLITGILIVSFLWLFIRLFIRTFYFTVISTNIKADVCKAEIITLLEQLKISYQKSNNMDNVFICMEYFAYSRSVLETTIIILDNSLLINTRNRNTAILSIHRGRLISIFRSHFKYGKQKNG